MQVTFALVTALCLYKINGLIMPMTKPDGSLDVSSLLSHIVLLEHSLESLETRLTDELKSTQLEVAVLKNQLNQCSCRSPGSQNSASSSEVRTLQTDVGHLKQEVVQLQSLHNTSSATSGGSTFTRWGRTSCPANSSVVYKGYTGGTVYSEVGGSATILCLPEHPIYPSYVPKDKDGTTGIYGTEYETVDSINPLHHLDDENMPCVVCDNSRSNSIMIPGRNACYPGWTLEYWGYLMGGFMVEAPSEYICVDAHPEAIPGGQANEHESRTLALVESQCGSLSCPPYIQDAELSCAVCSK